MFKLNSKSIKKVKNSKNRKLLYLGESFNRFCLDKNGKFLSHLFWNINIAGICPETREK